MQAPEPAEASVAEWLQRFVGFSDQVVFATEPATSWQAIISAVTLEAAKGLHSEHYRHTTEPNVPWWERTNESKPYPTEDVDPDLLADLLAAFISATTRLTSVAQQLRDATLRQRFGHHGEAEVVDDPDDPF